MLFQKAYESNDSNLLIQEILFDDTNRKVSRYSNTKNSDAYPLDNILSDISDERSELHRQTLKLPFDFNRRIKTLDRIGLIESN